MTDRKPKDKIAIQFRCDEAYNDRLERHADEPEFGGNKAQFVRFCTTVMMDLKEIHGANFDLIVAGLRTSAQKDPVAA